MVNNGGSAVTSRGSQIPIPAFWDPFHWIHDLGPFASKACAEPMPYGLIPIKLSSRSKILICVDQSIQQIYVENHQHWIMCCAVYNRPHLHHFTLLHCWLHSELLWSKIRHANLSNMKLPTWPHGAGVCSALPTGLQLTIVHFGWADGSRSPATCVWHHISCNWVMSCKMSTLPCPYKSLIKSFNSIFPPQAKKDLICSPLLQFFLRCCSLFLW